MALPLPSSIDLHSMLPLSEKQPARTKRAFGTATSTISLSTLAPPEGTPPARAREPPGSSIETSSLCPLNEQSDTHAAGRRVDSFVDRPFNATRSYAHTAGLAQAAGEAAAHVTDSQHPAAPASSWGEISDAAGQTSAIAARRTANGSCHFFGQSVWPNRDGLGPFHGHVLSDRGRQHYEGHFEPGRPTLAAEAAAQPITPGRRRQTSAHRETFDGNEMRTLLHGP